MGQLEFDESIYEQQWAVRTHAHLPDTPPPPPNRAHSAGTRVPFDSPLKLPRDHVNADVKVEVNLNAMNL